MTMAPVKLGMVGCGIAARELHLPALQAMPDKFEIVAVCNISEDKAREFAHLAGGVPYYLDYRALLARPDVEAVDIALPIHLNCQVTGDALQAGKHVIVEKPLAANMPEAESMLAFESGFPQVKMVAENFRYHDLFRRLKALIGQGRIGKPYAVFWDVFRRLDRGNKYAQTEWRINHRFPGGFITDGGVHNIAALRDLFGEITAGAAYTHSINPGIGEIDSFSFMFETASRISGVLNIYVSAPGSFENLIRIQGSEGRIRVENNRTIVIEREDGRESEALAEDGSYRAEFEDFYRAIRRGAAVVSTFSEAYKDLRTILAALNSAKLWQSHQLDL